MNPRRRRLVKLYAGIAFAGAVYGMLAQIIDLRIAGCPAEWPVIGILIGGGSGLLLASFESSRLAERVGRLVFWQTVLLKSITYILLGTLLAMGFTLFWGGVFQGLTLADFQNFLLRDPAFPIRVAEIFVFYLAAVLYRQIDHLLGPGRLLKYVTGYYHRPRRENRIFMFLDLRGSTTIAERLSPNAYFDLLQTCFADLSEAVIDTEGEIYQYVGDEAVITWKTESGLRHANCVWLFALFAARIHERRAHYQTHFGLVPEFKAGLHAGEVITAEIGHLRKDLVFNGDVLNTTARIEGVCNRFDKKLVASQTLVDRLPFIPPGFESESLGAINLPGKGEPQRLIALA